MILWKSEAFVIRIGINKQILTTNILLLFFALTVPGYQGFLLQGSEVDNYARMQRDLSKYARAQREVPDFFHASSSEEDVEDEDQKFVRELATQNNDEDKQEETGTDGQAVNEAIFPRSPLQIHKVNTRAGMRLRRLRRNGEGMRLRRLRRGGEGDKNMRLRRLRRTEIAMDVPRNDFYVVKRPNYETTLRSAFDEIMSNSICTVAGRLVPCIREPSA